MDGGGTGMEALKIALLLLGGGGGAKLLQMILDSIKGWRPKDERAQIKSEKDERVAIDLTEQLRALARDAVAEVRAEIDLERKKTARLTARVAQLEKALHDNHIEVPAEVL